MLSRDAIELESSSESSSSWGLFQVGLAHFTSKRYDVLSTELSKNLTRLTHRHIEHDLSALVSVSGGFCPGS